MLKNWADKTKVNGNYWINKLLNRINGWGVIFRFLLPMMVGMLLWNFNTKSENFQYKLDTIMKGQEEVKQDLTTYQTETRIYNQNHLAHHSTNEIKIEGRLSCIETELKRIK